MAPHCQRVAGVGFSNRFQTESPSPMKIALPLAILGLALTLAPASPRAAEIRPYLRGLVGLDVSRDATFKDADCADKKPAALFGCGPGIDGAPLGAYGDFGSSALFEVAAGLELTDYLRIEAALSHRPGFAFEGEANFLRTPGDQPVSGDVTQSSAMAFVYLEPLAALGKETVLQPFIGGGIGVSHNEIGEMTYDFPGLKQPAYSLMPGGSWTGFAWAATAGLGYEVSNSLTLELAYRYSDLGTVQTDDGTLFIQRHNFAKPIPIAETEADLVSQSVTVSARWRF